MVIFAKAGDVIACKGGAHHLLRFRCDIHDGDRIRSQQVESIDPGYAQPKPGNKIEACPHCGGAVIGDGIHFSAKVKLVRRDAA